MSNFPEKALNKAISRVPRGSYLTDTAAAANAYVREETKQRSLSKLSPVGVQDNSGYATGNGFASESWLEGWETSDNWQVDLASQNTGRYLLAAMGKVTTTQPDAVNLPDVYKHVFSYLPFLTTSQLPAYDLLEWLLPSANGINRRLASMIAKSFKIASSGKAKLEGTIDWRGSGERVEPSGVTFASHVNEIQGTLNYFFARQAELILSDTDDSNASNIKCELKSCNFSIENEQAENDWGCPRFVGDDPESGSLRSQDLTINQKFMMDWRMKMRNDSPEHVALLNQSPLKIVSKWIGAALGSYGGEDYFHQLNITSYLAKYAAVDDGFEDGMAIVDVKPNLLFNVSANKIVEVELYNDVPSYTV